MDLKTLNDWGYIEQEDRAEDMYWDMLNYALDIKDIAHANNDIELINHYMDILDYIK